MKKCEKSKTYNELTKIISENRVVIRNTPDKELKRILIIENHELMKKIDRM